MVVIVPQSHFSSFLILKSLLFLESPLVLVSISANIPLDEMHGIVGRAWCYDRCINVHTYTIDNLHM